MSSVDVSGRSLKSATLTWENPRADWKYYLETNGTDVSVEENISLDTVSYSVSDLQPGTLYSFSVITQFSDLNSTAYNGFIITSMYKGLYFDKLLKRFYYKKLIEKPNCLFI